MPTSASPIVLIAVATSLLPRLLAAAAAGRWQDVVTCLVVVPAADAMVLLTPVPVCTVLELIEESETVEKMQVREESR